MTSQMKLRYTYGVNRLIEEYKCNWLVTAIASHQPRCMKDKMLREIQFWSLEKGEGNQATLKCFRDTDDLAFQQKIPFTDFFNDFEGDSVKLYVDGSVLMLPSEY